MLMDLVEQALDSALPCSGCLHGSVQWCHRRAAWCYRGALGILQGVLGAIKGAAAMIQGLMANVLDLIDMICGGDLSLLWVCPPRTCHGPKESEGDKTKKRQSQW